MLTSRLIHTLPLRWHQTALGSLTRACTTSDSYRSAPTTELPGFQLMSIVSLKQKKAWESKIADEAFFTSLHFLKVFLKNLDKGGPSLRRQWINHVVSKGFVIWWLLCYKNKWLRPSVQDVGLKIFAIKAEKGSWRIFSIVVRLNHEKETVAKKFVLVSKKRKN